RSGVEQVDADLLAAQPRRKLRGFHGDVHRLGLAIAKGDPERDREHEREPEGPEDRAGLAEEEPKPRERQLPERIRPRTVSRARRRRVKRYALAFQGGVHSRRWRPVRWTNTSSRLAWCVERRVTPRTRCRIAGSAMWRCSTVRAIPSALRRAPRTPGSVDRSSGSTSAASSTTSSPP